MSTNYSKLVFTAGLALFVVRWEPAPFDICILLLALALATRLPSRKVRSWVAEMPLAAFYLYGYVFFSILSLLFSTHVRSACLYLGITVYLVFAYLVLVSTLNNDRVARQALSHGYILATLISAVLGVLAIRLNHIYDFDILLYGGARAQGLFKDPNVYGPFLVPSILAMVSRIFVIDNPAFSCGCLILLVFALIFSFSRGAWLNLAVGMFVWLLVDFRTVLARPRRAVGLLLLLMLTLCIYVSYSDVSYLIQRLGFQAYDADRFGTQALGIRLATRNILGIGPGEFEASIRYASHNTYIRLLAENGWFAFIFFIAFVSTVTLRLANGVSLWNRSAKLGRLDVNHGMSPPVILASMFGLLINSFFVDTLHWRHFWVILALGSLDYKEAKKYEGLASSIHYSIQPERWLESKSRRKKGQLRK
ncbi:MAG: hypothetical protein GX998_05110 [Firmicutes bacterium]|nr:hypothetical protein [Bacillota bacterium]